MTAVHNVQRNANIWIFLANRMAARQCISNEGMRHKLWSCWDLSMCWLGGWGNNKIWMCSWVWLQQKLPLWCCKGMIDTSQHWLHRSWRFRKVYGMRINGLDINGRRLKNLQVRYSFYNYNNKSWFKFFAPKLETFCWKDNELPKGMFSAQFPIPETSSNVISHCRAVNMGSAEIEYGAVSFLSGVSSAHEYLLYCLLISGGKSFNLFLCLYGLNSSCIFSLSGQLSSLFWCLVTI